MFNKQHYTNSRSGGIGVLEVVAGPEEAGEQTLFVPLKRTELRGDVTGPLAALCLVQTYQFSREACDRVIEAVYRFPLPGDAAVTGARVTFGDVEIVTTLKEREEAEAEYQEAVDAGKQAALLTRESPDVFTLRVAGIKPDEAVVVETEYVQLARPYGDVASWLLRIPLTTAPRYVREDELESRYAQGQPLVVLRDPGHRFALDICFHNAGEITSPTHQIDVLPGDDAQGWQVRLSDGEVLPDRDCVLVWTPSQEQRRPKLSVLLHKDPEAGQAYFLALVAPPSQHKPGTGVPREVALLVDHSGSMRGAKWEASDWTVNSFLSSLMPHDFFALGLFHTTTKWFAKAPHQATEKELQAAAKYLDKNRDSGGTNLGVALEQALKLKRIKDDPLSRHLLIITDAQVSDAGRIFRLADQEAKHKQRRRISVLCIDAAPNSFLANELAERGGGVAYFLTSSPDEGDITTALEQVLVDWSEPVLAGLELEIDCPNGEATGQGVDTKRGRTFIDLGGLPCGRAIWVAGRVPLDGRESLTFRVGTAHEDVEKLTLSLDEALEQPALKALFGARRILGLEYLSNSGYKDDMLKEQLERLGYDPKEIATQEESVYAENTMRALRESLKPLLVSESLRYGIACAETAFVAVRKEAGEQVEARVAVANALPAGWSEGFAAPSGGLGSGMSLGAAMMRGGAPRSQMMDMAAPPPSPGPREGVKALGQALGLGKRRRREESEAEESAAVARGPLTIFSGTPTFTNAQAVLFDSTQKDAKPVEISGQAQISRIEVKFVSGMPDPGSIDRKLSLLIFVGDMALPRATVRLADLMRGGGERPLNLRKRAGQDVRVVLDDPRGAWAANPPEIEVVLDVR